MLQLKVFGSYKNIFRYLSDLSKFGRLDFLDKYGQMGVDALKAATPVDTGKTADSWYYKIDKRQNQNGGWTVKITWGNTNRVDYTGKKRSAPVAVLLEYGHATRNGGYVQGLHYIKPAIRPIFRKILAEAQEALNNI